MAIYERPAAILRLAHDIDLVGLRSRIIALPALNTPAFYAGTRVSPIDDRNLNRAFPGARLGNPTDMIAQFRRNLALARVFGAPLLWVLGGGLEVGSVSGAASRRNVPMIATEHGGGGTVTPHALAVGNTGIRNVLIHLGMIEGEIPVLPARPAVEACEPAALYAPTGGVFEPWFEPGETINAGQLAGRLHPLPDLERSPIELAFPEDGLVTRAWPGGQRLLHSFQHQSRHLGAARIVMLLAEPFQHHHGGENGGDRIGHPLPRNIRRAAMGRLEEPMGEADIGRRRQAKPA